MSKDVTVMLIVKAVAIVLKKMFSGWIIRIPEKNNILTGIMGADIISPFLMDYNLNGDNYLAFVFTDK